jgi:hypothetical protein
MPDRRDVGPQSDVEPSLRKTFEFVAVAGPEQDDFAPLFSSVGPNEIGSFDAVHDVANMPLNREPPQVLIDLDNAGEL